MTQKQELRSAQRTPKMLFIITPRTQQTLFQIITDSNTELTEGFDVKEHKVYALPSKPNTK